MNIIEKIVAWIGSDDLRSDLRPLVKYKKLHPDAKAPFRAHPTDAGWDLSCVSWEWDDDGNVVYHTGLAIELPRGYVGLLFPRSSNAKKDLLLSNSVGNLDADFRGEVLAKFKPSLSFHSQHRDIQLYEPGDRIGQMVLMPVYDVQMQEADELSETERGEGGYGSSGA